MPVRCVQVPRFAEGSHNGHVGKTRAIFGLANGATLPSHNYDVGYKQCQLVLT